MKESKKSRRKAIPHHYQKRSRSNTSLSQLVHIASYKKRINDLSRNNRLLAVALQECRIEMALQTNLLKDYAGDRNQILFARLKLNEMAKDVAKFVSDLEEVRNYLNIDLPAFQQKNGSPNERIIKAPTVNIIEEVSIVASENEVSSSEAVPDVNKTSDPMPLNKPKENAAEVQPNTSKNSPDLTNDVEMAPILFVDDPEEKNKKSSSRSKHSKTSNIAEGSLTPELDIDLTYSKRKRTSSRRMTQFSFPEARSYKSRERSAPSEKKNSSEEELITPERPISPTQMNVNENPAKVDRILHEISQSPFMENIMEEQRKSISNSGDVYDPHLNNPSVDPVAVEAVLPCIKQIECNHTLLTCEDMELTEVVRSANQIVVGSEAKHPGDSKLDAVNPSEIMEQDGDDKEINSEAKACKLSDCPQTSATISNDALIPEARNTDFEDEILNVGELTFCEPNEESDDSFSPVIRRSRPKKPVQYALYFSSDESDKESPVKPVFSKRKVHKGKKGTTDLIHEKNYQKTIQEKDGEITQDCLTAHKISSGVENKVPKNDLAVYNLDVSNSEKPGHNKQRKKIKTSKDKKSRIQELPKPLLQNCSVTKLKAGNYKFSKSKISSEKLKEFNHQLQKCLPSGESPISPSSILKKSQCDLSQNHVEEIKTPLKKNGYEDNVEANQSNIIHSKLRDVLETPKSESRRVSFAPTDLVCNFKKMSVSKKIADNKKVRRTSKSVLEFSDLLETDQERKACHIDTDTSSRSKMVKNLDVPNFNFSDDTELYTFTLPPNRNAPVILPDDLCQPLKLAISENVSQTKAIIDNNKKVNLILKSPKQTGKLSLKRNKIIQKEVSCTPSKIETETNVLLAESPKAVIIKAKRKSLFKELLEEDFKENACPDQQPSENLDSVLSRKPVKAINSPSGSVKIHKKKSLASNKRLSKVSSKNSLKRNNLSDKHKLPQITPEEKKKKDNFQTNPHEASPVLKDLLNTTGTDEIILPKRRSKPVSYKEPKLNKKMRRE